MSALHSRIRAGAYFDSIVLMQLQAALCRQPGVEDAGAVMATPANLALLEASGLLPAEAGEARPDDLVIAVRAATDSEAGAALDKVDELLVRRDAGEAGEYRPKSLAAAVRQRPASRWVAVSVPGRYATGVAREALGLGRNVFLYSDNVALDDEIDLKREAAGRGLLVMGPDCGTAAIGGVGLGFANRVRRGPIGLIAASGTGLQAVASRIDRLGNGVSHALGTGGRDLGREVGGATALAAVDLLARDPATGVLVVLSKPPAPAVATRLLAAVRDTGKPAVIHFLGWPAPGRRIGRLRFAVSLDDAADLAVAAAAEEADDAGAAVPAVDGSLRALFSGGTLAQEVLLGLTPFLAPIASNLTLPGGASADGDRVVAPADPGRSSGHALLDLGGDEYTVGRPHPMIDQDLRLRRLRQEAADPACGLLLLDVVLGDGAHADPAAELAPAIAEIRRRRAELPVGVLLIGAEGDPQDVAAQAERLTEAGADLLPGTAAAVEYALDRLLPSSESPSRTSSRNPVALGALEAPAVINVGLEAFSTSLAGQGADVLVVDWRPPAGGDERMQALLERLRG